MKIPTFRVIKNTRQPSIKHVLVSQILVGIIANGRLTVDFAALCSVTGCNATPSMLMLAFALLSEDASAPKLAGNVSNAGAIRYLEQTLQYIKNNNTVFEASRILKG